MAKRKDKIKSEDMGIKLQELMNDLVLERANELAKSPKDCELTIKIHNGSVEMEFDAINSHTPALLCVMALPLCIREAQLAFENKIKKYADYNDDEINAIRTRIKLAYVSLISGVLSSTDDLIKCVHEEVRE